MVRWSARSAWELGNKGAYPDIHHLDVVACIDLLAVGRLPIWLLVWRTIVWGTHTHTHKHTRVLLSVRVDRLHGRFMFCSR